MTITAGDQRYAEAKNHPVAGVILAALHEQDARTYSGSSGGIAELALDTAAAVERRVRVDERIRLADLLEANREVLADWPRDTGKALEMVVFLLRMNHRDDSDPPPAADPAPSANDEREEVGG